LGRYLLDAYSDTGEVLRFYADGLIVAEVFLVGEADEDVLTLWHLHLFLFVVGVERDISLR
jgi:hypothetical protein